MSGWIEIIIAIVVLGIMARYINYVLAFFTIIPSELTVLTLFAVSISIVLFIIHRKG